MTKSKTGGGDDVALRKSPETLADQGSNLVSLLLGEI